MSDHTGVAGNSEGADRRAFLAAAGKLAVIVPPSMTYLLTTTMSSDAIALSGSDAPAAYGCEYRRTQNPCSPGGKPARPPGA
jgi:hypothetical protein